jgi:GntR family transcriptional repressor for pyruvate dehydrogenase complex
MYDGRFGNEENVMSDANINAFTAIQRPSAVEDVIQTIQQALIRGDLQPGQRLPSEAKLVQQLGVGRGTIREATKMLSAMGVVESRQGDGTYICDKITPKVINPLLFTVLVESKNVEDLYEFRRMVDVGYSTLAAEKATDEDFERMEALIAVMAAYREVAERDIEALVEMDFKFHLAILEATQNPLMIKVGQMIMEMFRQTIRQSLSTIGGVRWTVSQHRRLLEALRSRDATQVREAVIMGLEGSRTRQDNV